MIYFRSLGKCQVLSLDCTSLRVFFFNYFFVFPVTATISLCNRAFLINVNIYFSSYTDNSAKYPSDLCCSLRAAFNFRGKLSPWLCFPVWVICRNWRKEKIKNENKDFQWEKSAAEVRACVTVLCCDFWVLPVSKGVASGLSLVGLAMFSSQERRQVPLWAV